MQWSLYLTHTTNKKFSSLIKKKTITKIGYTKCLAAKQKYLYRWFCWFLKTDNWGLFPNLLILRWCLFYSYLKTIMCNLFTAWTFNTYIISTSCVFYTLPLRFNNEHNLSSVDSPTIPIFMTMSSVIKFARSLVFLKRSIRSWQSLVRL